MSSQTPIGTSERVYQELRQMVVMGDLAQGDRLIQRQLAARLGVSSIPVIEATRRLQQDGLVVQHPNWGAQVRQWTEIDIQAAYRARAALEGIACEMFVLHAGRSEKARLLELDQLFRERVEAGDSNGWCEADLAIHSHIVRSSQASSLVQAVESSCLITMTLRTSVRRHLAQRQGFPDAGVHEGLLAALLGGSPRAAHRAGRKHVQGGYRKLAALKNEAAG